MKLSSLLKFGTGFVIGTIVGGAFIFSSIVEFEYMLETAEKVLPEGEIEIVKKDQPKKTKKTTSSPKARKSTSTNSNK